ncbi:exosome rnase ph-like protein [Vairimorpha apis BRL 01]|uniref:Exosome rnase ph-like protein n=1 Tax=Vairimorpha apis BRL 01 TaxID=1037528 RepID=T0ML48_9MICR|nr:exosome rnase ph-like protein [Vairimorpha apis BRL 01]
MNKIEASINTIKNATGSSYFKYKSTVVICTIDLKHKNDCLAVEDYNTVLFDIRYRNINNKIFDRYCAMIIKKILQYFVLNIDVGKTIFVNLIVDSTDINSTWCSINALFLGLLDAGVPLKDCFFATSSFTKNDDFCILNNNKEVIFFDWTDEVDENFFNYVKEILMFTCKKNLLYK